MMRPLVLSPSLALALRSLCTPLARAYRARPGRAVAYRRQSWLPGAR